MSDERLGNWFAPDLRDVRSAFVAEVLVCNLLVATLAKLESPAGPPASIPEGWVITLVFAGLLLVAVGMPVLAFYSVSISPFRALGFSLPFTLLLVALVALNPTRAELGLVLLTVAAGIPIFLYYRTRPAELRVPETWQRRTVNRYWWVRSAVLAGGLAGWLWFSSAFRKATQAGEFQFAWWVYQLILSLVLCVWCWLRFLRPFVELCLEPIARTLYRVKAKGVKQFPPFGPCLVIANHGFWFDPCILGTILPRPITPIMTQRFYEHWFLKPLLKYVFRVIVVPETPIKRTTPELEQAVAALDRGEVVVIFPEGYLRRKEEVPLRRFGQGVWRILSARPDTPVVACWIEGGWGSKFSYKDGPPTKNKPMDFRRKIDVAVSAPDTVPAELLTDQMATRIHLMNRVAAMRAELGLAPLPAFEVRQAADHQDEPA